MLHDAARPAYVVDETEAKYEAFYFGARVGLTTQIFSDGLQVYRVEKLSPTPTTFVLSIATLLLPLYALCRKDQKRG